MMKYNNYCFYAKNDVKKEPIDKIGALNEKDALEYFINRKQMDIFSFKLIYEIQIYEDRFK